MYFATTNNIFKIALKQFTTSEDSAWANAQSGWRDENPKK